MQATLNPYSRKKDGYGKNMIAKVLYLMTCWTSKGNIRKCMKFEKSAKTDLYYILLYVTLYGLYAWSCPMMYMCM